MRLARMPDAAYHQIHSNLCNTSKCNKKRNMCKFKSMALVVLIMLGARHIVPLRTANAQDTAPVCPSPNDLAPQLAVDLWARVGSGLAHNVREAPTTQAAIVAQVPDGDIFRVMDGPTCAEGYVWWGVDYAGTQGWMAEGDPDTGQYWLVALDGQDAPP